MDDTARVFWETQQIFLGNCGHPFDALTAIASERTSWPAPISVSERLPELGVNVLAWDASGDEWVITALDTGTGNWLQEDLWYLTHWLPLPPNPEGE